MLVDCSQAVAHLCARPGGVLFLDTCSLLDVIRLAGKGMPHFPGERALEHVASLLTQVEARRLHLVASDVVQQQLAHMTKAVYGEVLSHVRSVTRDALRLVNLASSLTRTGAPATTDRGSAPGPAFLPEAETLVDPLSRLVDALAARVLWVESSGACLELANQMRKEGKKPSGRGGAEFDDCLVVATALCTSRGIRAQELSCPIVLLSSNFDHFYDNRRQGPHPDFKPDFDSADIQLVRNFSHAWAVLSAGLSQPLGPEPEEGISSP